MLLCLSGVDTVYLYPHVCSSSRLATGFRSYLFRCPYITFAIDTVSMYVASRLSTSNCVLYSLFQWLSSKALYYSLRTSLVLIGNDLKECWVVQLFTHDIHQNIWFIRFERLLVIGPLRMKGLFLTICCLLRHVEPSWDLCLCFSCQYKHFSLRWPLNHIFLWTLTFYFFVEYLMIWRRYFVGMALFCGRIIPSLSITTFRLFYQYQTS